MTQLKAQKRHWLAHSADQMTQAELGAFEAEKKILEQKRRDGNDDPDPDGDPFAGVYPLGRHPKRPFSIRT